MSQPQKDTPFETALKMVQTYLADLKQQTLTTHGKDSTFTKFVNTQTAQINKNIERFINNFPEETNVIIEATEHHLKQQQKQKQQDTEEADCPNGYFCENCDGDYLCDPVDTLPKLTWCSVSNSKRKLEAKM